MCVCGGGGGGGGAHEIFITAVDFHLSLHLIFIFSYKGYLQMKLNNWCAVDHKQMKFGTFVQYNSNRTKQFNQSD